MLCDDGMIQPLLLHVLVILHVTLVNSQMLGTMHVAK